MTGDDVYLDKEKMFEVEHKDCANLKIPPRPVPLYKANPDTDPKKYEGDTKNIPRRAAHKLYNIWLFWIALRCNEKLETILKKESEQDTDEFLLKATIVQVLDHLAKALVDGDPLEEIGELLKNNEN